MCSCHSFLTLRNSIIEKILPTTCHIYLTWTKLTNQRLSTLQHPIKGVFVVSPIKAVRIMRLIFLLIIKLPSILRPTHRSLH